MTPWYSYIIVTRCVVGIARKPRQQPSINWIRRMEAGANLKLQCWFWWLFWRSMALVTPHHWHICLRDGIKRLWRRQRLATRTNYLHMSGILYPRLGYSRPRLMKRGTQWWQEYFFRTIRKYLNGNDYFAIRTTIFLKSPSRSSVKRRNMKWAIFVGKCEIRT